MDGLTRVLSFCIRASMACVVLVFVVLVGFIFLKGSAHLSVEMFAWQYNSQNLSMTPAIINTLNIVLFALCLAVPFGVFGALYLSEYSSQKNKILKIIRIASETLVGIPSIVYGLFGYLAFVIYFGFRTSFLAGGLTLAIMVLPLILRSSEEALKSVPMSFREASYALGAGKLRTIFVIILPAALPGILAGVILSIGRIVGESAALLYTSGSVAKIAGLMDSGRTLSVHMYAISNEGLHINEAYSTAMVLIVIVCLINLSANALAKRFVKV